jgi:tRNA A37 N6-isopentenylltransferase MiaA
MEKEIRLELKADKVESLELYAELLKKDINTMLDEALELYFQVEQEKLLEKNQNDENAMTNLDFDEFWEGVDL